MGLLGLALDILGSTEVVMLHLCHVFPYRRVTSYVVWVSTMPFDRILVRRVTTLLGEWWHCLGTLGGLLQDELRFKMM